MKQLCTVTALVLTAGIVWSGANSKSAERVAIEVADTQFAIETSFTSDVDLRWHTPSHSPIVMRNAFSPRASVNIRSSEKSDSAVHPEDQFDIVYVVDEVEVATTRMEISYGRYAATAIDLDQDGNDELVIESLRGRGTGVAEQFLSVFTVEKNRELKLAIVLKTVGNITYQSDGTKSPFGKWKRMIQHRRVNEGGGVLMVQPQIEPGRVIAEADPDAVLLATREYKLRVGDGCVFTLDDGDR